MKKNLLFGLLTILVAGFGFGGVSSATVVDCVLGDPAIKNENAVAEIGNVCYDSLVEAFAASENEQTIVLLKDVTVNDRLDVGSETIKKSIIFDMHSNTLSFENNKTIYIYSDNELTITGNGNIVGPSNGKDYDGKSMIYVDGNGRLIYLNGTLTAYGEGDSGMYGIYAFGNGTAVFGSENNSVGPTITTHFAAIGTNNTTPTANIIIYGGRYEALLQPSENWNNDGWYYFAAPIYAAAGGNYDIQGGLFKGYFGISSRYLHENQNISISDNVEFNVNKYSIFVDEKKGTTEGGNRNITSPTKNLSIPATYVWIKNGSNYKVVKGFTISFDSDGGTSVEDITVEAGGSISEPESPLKDGYELDKWYNGESEFDFNETINSNVELKAHWNTVNYNINYNLKDGEINGEGNPESYTIETPTITLAGATKDGYVLSGWYLDNGFTNQITSIVLGSTGDIEIYPQWKPELENAVENATADEKVISTAGTTVSVGALVNQDGSTLTIDFEQGISQVADSSAEDNNDKTVKSNELVDNSKEATVKGGLEVYVQSGSVKYTGSTAIFNKPIALRIPVSGMSNGSKVKVKVKHHGGTFGYKGLTLKADDICLGDGGATNEYNGSDIEVQNGHVIIYTCSASTFVAYTEANKVTSSSSSSTGKSGGSSTTTTKKDDKKDDTQVIELKGEVTEETTTTGEVKEENTKSDVIISDAAKAAYNDEQLAAYQWAYDNGITTINEADKARLSDPLTRAELAKMMSQYISSVLKKSPIKADLPGYKDVDESLGDLADYIVKAYQYQIMGIDADGNALEYFNPNGLVTRAEYATVFSRVLYGSANNQKDGPYYEKHLAALKEAGILSNDNPTIEEVRGWVMLMMYRSANEKASTQEESKTEEGTGNNVGIANPASTYCVEQEGEIEIREETDGGQYGVCKFKDGTEVEEWEYFRANHKDETTTGAVAESTTGAVAEATTGATAETSTGSTTKSN